MARWDGINEFVNVVDAGSFTAAAERMGIANSQVSKRVAQLEARLGIRLLNRTTRKFTLTDEGEHYYQHCRRHIEAFDEVEMALSSGQSEPRGHLRINLSGSFQERFFVPILTRFLGEHPRLTLSIEFTDQPVDMITGGFDIAVCSGELQDSSMVARKVADLAYYLVAHPDYLAEHGTPRRVSDLEHHNCLIGTERNWYFSKGRQSIQVKVDGNWHSPNGAALLNAALGGLGIARLPFFAAQDALARGDLVQVLEPWNRYREPVWIMYPQNRYLSAKVRVCIDYMLEQLYRLEF